MGNIINLSEHRNNQRDEIEKLARSQYSVIKISDDLFLLPEVVFKSGSEELDALFEELGATSKDMLEEDVVKEINSIITKNKDKKNIGIMLFKQEEDNMLTFEIFTELGKFLISTQMGFNRENTRIFTGIVAGAVKRKDVEVTHFLKLNYEELKELVK